MKYARFALSALLAVSLCAAATPDDGIVASKWDNAKQTYIAQLSSENSGVKASAANFIRKYNIVEAVDELKKILVCDNCETVKLSATLALVQIAGEDGENAIRKALILEENEMIAAFYNVLLHSKTDNLFAPVSEN